MRKEDLIKAVGENEFLDSFIKKNDFVNSLSDVYSKQFDEIESIEYQYSKKNIYREMVIIQGRFGSMIRINVSGNSLRSVNKEIALEIYGDEAFGRIHFYEEVENVRNKNAE